MKYLRWMTAFILPLAIAAVFFSCTFQPRQNPAARLVNPTPLDYITGWPEMGMWLPDEDEVSFFASRLEAACDPLRQALGNADHSIRMRAAYVIGEIGKNARNFGPDLLARLKYEPDRVVRMYIVNALNTISCNDESAIPQLTERFDSLDSTNVISPPFARSYAEVDEKITVAAALYVLKNDDKKAEYYSFVTSWLKPPPDEMSSSLLEGYWERRWHAVNVLERMPGAVAAIPMLESLQAEPSAPSWVNVHVPRVIGALAKKP